MVQPIQPTSHMCCECKCLSCSLYIYVYIALVLCGLWFYIGIPILCPSLSSSLHFQNLNKPTNVEGTYTVSVFSSLCLYMLPTLPPFRVTTQCCCKWAYNLGVKEWRKPIPVFLSRWAHNGNFTWGKRPVVPDCRECLLQHTLSNLKETTSRHSWSSRCSSP